MMPKVSIVVTAFLEQSKPYLDLCIQSIKNLDYDNFEVVVVSPKWYRPTYPNVINVHPEKEQYYNAHALNMGARVNPDGEYLFFLNDDVILTKDCLRRLLESSRALGDACITMPIGNDQQRAYCLPTGMMSPVPYKIEQVKEHGESLMNASSFYPCGMIFPEVLCLYAVLVPRRVFNVVGEFDEGGWQDDIDYSRRVRLKGFLNVISMTSLVWHAGGVSADITQGALDSKIRAESLKRHNEKWADK